LQRHVHSAFYLVIQPPARRSDVKTLHVRGRPQTSHTPSDGCASTGRACITPTDTTTATVTPGTQKSATACDRAVRAHSDVVTFGGRRARRAWTGTCREANHRAGARSSSTPVKRADIPEFGLLLEDVFDLSDLLLDFAGEVFGFAFCL
jgi:hypothetical protein